MGGSAAGGAPAGGTPAGGSLTGGVAAGGAPAGGAGSGGIVQGGSSSGGAFTGGIGTGGVGTGGTATGGSTGTCPGSDRSGAVNIDVSTEYQTISGYGGASIPAWIADLTEAQVNTAFGNGPDQMGLTILRIRVPPNEADFSKEVATPKRAQALGAKVMATPWTPPPSMKDNNSNVGGRLKTDSYGAYADHLLKFRDYLQSNGVTLYAISVQNEPDIDVNYDSCYWNSSEFINWLTQQGSKFTDVKLMVAESFNFDRTLTDPILNHAAAAAEVDIIAGHIYGNGLSDYPLARSKGKEVWMTEHYTDSNNSANAWPLALDVAKELHNCMVANFNAYVWWYIRRSYGLLTEDGAISKRGWLMAQYSKFVRPGYVRISASAPSSPNVLVTAYKSDSQVVVVAVNMNTSPQTITLNVRNRCVTGFTRYTTSGSKNLSNDGSVTLTDNWASVTLDAQSTTTFVSQ